MNHIEVSHKPELQWIKISENGVCRVEQTHCENLSVELSTELPVIITVEFQPYGIRPMIRYNGFLLNYWLADIMLYDHLAEFTVTESFYIDYKNKDIQGRLAHLSAEEHMMDNLYDKYIGVNNLYPELVQEIKDLLR